ncbi:biliverdin-producing heme oxygenase [Cognatilysobacter segetis]|uniref:biliverdin-producing heme oxygenase n=1 Tax=Cognatilysobacter segetis TaxID=2492394 RepID=UPI00138FDE29|nr:biliverdin-producing heme oxygenase [Lysobacter segetis]
MHSSHDTLRWRLRHATAEAHARVDARIGDFTDVASYAAFLQAMHRFVRSARRVLGDPADLVACQLALEADLADVGRPPLPGEPDAAPRRDDARLGWRYVLAGSALGARLLLRRVATLGFDATRGARYLARHASGDAWPSLLASLDGLHLDETAQRAACDAANAAFAQVERALDDARDVTA